MYLTWWRQHQLKSSIVMVSTKICSVTTQVLNSTKVFLTSHNLMVANKHYWFLMTSWQSHGDYVDKIFTKFSHHRNISIIYLSQNLFYKSKQNRTMSLNAHYLVIFKSPRDQNQLATLARQMYPGNSKFLIEAFKDATQQPYGYLLINLKSDTEERLRIRTNIFSTWHTDCLRSEII